MGQPGSNTKARTPKKSRWAKIVLAQFGQAYWPRDSRSCWEPETDESHWFCLVKTRGEIFTLSVYVVSPGSTDDLWWACHVYYFRSPFHFRRPPDVVSDFERLCSAVEATIRADAGASQLRWLTSDEFGRWARSGSA
jgi:hypothetical protein